MPFAQEIGKEVVNIEVANHCVYCNNYNWINVDVGKGDSWFIEISPERKIDYPKKYMVKIKPGKPKI